ncbi:MAG: hypothetical protein QM811_31295 [Pirellulales bacterium]
MSAAYALSAVTQRAEPGLERLLSAMAKSGDGETNRAANFASEYVLQTTQDGKFLDRMLPAFKQGLKHKSSVVRENSILGIADIAPPDALELLTPFTKDEEDFVSDYAQLAIEKLKETRKAASGK